MLVKLNRLFKFCHRPGHVQAYHPGVQELPQAVADAVISAGAGEAVKAKAAPKPKAKKADTKSKAKKAAPENKSK